MAISNADKQYTYRCRERRRKANAKQAAVELEQARGYIEAWKRGFHGPPSQQVLLQVMELLESAQKKLTCE